MESYPFTYQWLIAYSQAPFGPAARGPLHAMAQQHGYEVNDWGHTCTISPDEAYKYDYKLRIHPSPEQVEQAWDVIMPVLVREGLTAKVVLPKEGKLSSDIAARNKMITVYADYTDGPYRRDWKSIMTELAHKLMQAGITSGDKPVDDTEVKILESGKPVTSLLSYRDEREERYVPPKRGWLSRRKPDDPFAGIIIDIKDPIVEDANLSSLQRRQRQAFIISPMPETELSHQVEWGPDAATMHRADYKRFSATVADWGIRPRDLYARHIMDSSYVYVRFSDKDWQKVPKQFRRSRNSTLGR